MSDKLVLTEVKDSVLESLIDAMRDVGQVPINCSKQVGDLLDGDDVLMLVCLGRFLDEACKLKSYDPLIRGLVAIDRWQKEMSENR